MVVNEPGSSGFGIKYISSNLNLLSPYALFTSIGNWLFCKFLQLLELLPNFDFLIDEVALTSRHPEKYKGSKHVIHLWMI